MVVLTYIVLAAAALFVVVGFLAWLRFSLRLDRSGRRFRRDHRAWLESDSEGPAPNPFDY